MNKKIHKKLKWRLALVLITQLICFFPGDMVPLPLIVYEPFFEGLLGGWEYTYEIISKFIVIGRIAAIVALISRRANRTLASGMLATILLISGNIIWLVHEQVSLFSFEVMTSIPFVISIILFWFTGLKNRTEKSPEILTK